MKKRKLLAKALARSRNLRFDDLVVLVESFGFRLDRVSGSHHIFLHPKVERPLNLQNLHGKAKQYQVHQFLEMIEEYNLELGDEP